MNLYFQLAIYQRPLSLLYTLPQGIKSHLFDSFIIFIIGHILRLLPVPLTDLTDFTGICGMQHYLICPFGGGQRSFMCYLWRLALLCRFMCLFGSKKGLLLWQSACSLHSSLSPLNLCVLIHSLRLSVCLSSRTIPCA